MSDDDRVGPKFLNEKRTQSRGTKPAEKRIARSLGGRRVSGSGATPVSQRAGVFGRSKFGGKAERGKTVTRDGDVATDELHIEHKRTKTNSISVSKKILEKVRRGAARRGATPAMVLTFEGPGGSDDWILLPRSVYSRIVAEKDED